MRDSNGIPKKLEVRSRAELAENAHELLVRGDWVCLNIQLTVPWPVYPQELHFDGYRIWIIPITTECYPGVAVNCLQGISKEAAESLLYRFLSVISWREEYGISVSARTGGSLPHMLGRERDGVVSIRHNFDFTEVICPEDEGARVALALMREARSLNHHGYAFLTYWRILEWSFPRSKKRDAWLIAKLPLLEGYGVAEAKASIEVKEPTLISKHLFESGRCAMAHAKGHPIINPDNPNDITRLYRELPIVRELAIRAIEERFGIETTFTEYKKHLYELRGWKEELGPQWRRWLLEQIEFPENETINLPEINVRIFDSEPYPAFEELLPHAASLVEQGLSLQYRSKSGLMAFCFILNFSEERLLFDLSNGIFLGDDGSIISAEHRRDVARFTRDYMLNGSLQFWNVQTGKLLSRVDPFIPVNCMINLDAFNKGIDAAESELSRRKSLVDGSRKI